MTARQPARVVLGVLAAAYLLVYLFVLFVAFATSGSGLLRSPGAWYAAVAPVCYVGTAGACAFRWITWRLPRGAAIALHAAALPALVFSFMGLGLLLPVFAGLWWFVEREPKRAAA